MIQMMDQRNHKNNLIIISMAGDQAKDKFKIYNHRKARLLLLSKV